MPKGIKHKDVGSTLSYEEFHAADAHDFEQGTSFPESPSEGDLYYRTDDKLWYQFNGTMWNPLSVRGLMFYRRRGTAAPECWYTSAITAVAATTFTTADNRLYAIPFIVPRRIRLDRIAIVVTTASTNAVPGRLGIYRDDGNLYPANLVLDAGDTGNWNSTGSKIITIDVTLPPGLYWLVVGTQAMGSTKAVLRAIALGSFPPILGVSSGLGTAWNTNYSVAWTYGSLPSTFPSGASVVTSAPPAIYVRLAT